MGIYIESVDTASATVRYARQGEVEDVYGTCNELPAIVPLLDDAVTIEGTNEDLVTLATRMLDQIPQV